MQWPIKIKSSAAFIEELQACETGIWEDGQIAAEQGTEGPKPPFTYDILDRHKTQIEFRDWSEVVEVWWACESGTIEEFRPDAANSLSRKLRALIREHWDEIPVKDQERVAGWERSMRNIQAHVGKMLGAQ